jgi:protein TonB
VPDGPETYRPRSERRARGRFVLFGAGATALIFLTLVVANSLSLSRAPVEVKAIDVSLQPPPPPPEEEPPPPEEKRPEDAPELENKQEQLTLEQIDIVLNPGTGGGAGDLAVGNLLGGFNALDEVEAFDLGDLDRQPVLIAPVEPAYPYEMLRLHEKGRVTVAFIVDETGGVLAPRIESSTNAAFDRPALDAVRLWRFEPGVKDGRAVRARMRQLFLFTPPE